VKLPFTRLAATPGQALLATVLLALVVRLALLIALHDSYYTAGMAQGELARNLAEGRGFVVNIPFSDSLARLQVEQRRLIDVEEGLRIVSPADRPEDFRPFIAYMMPGQGMLLALTHLVSGHYRYLELQTVQAIADAFSVLFIYGIALTLFGKRVGLLAALLGALYIPSARMAISATRDAWMPLVYLGTSYAFILAWKSRRVAHFALAGGIVAVGSYFRSEVLMLPVFLAAGLFLLERKQRALARFALIGMIPVAVAIVPWTVRNYTVFDRLIPTNSGLWMAMWQSFGEYPNDFGASNNDNVTLAQMRALGYTESYESPEYDDLFREKVLNVVRERPGWVMWTIARRMARIPFQMHSWGIPQTDEMSLPESSYGQAGKVDAGAYWDYVSTDPLRGLVHLVTRGLNAFLYAAAGLVLLRHRRSIGKKGLLLCLVPLYNILVHAVIGVHARYILPTNPLLLIFVAYLFIAPHLEDGLDGAAAGNAP